MTIEQINTGAILRIADATEKMASNYDEMRESRDRFQLWHQQERDRSAKLTRTIRGLRSVITRLKRKGHHA